MIAIDRITFTIQNEVTFEGNGNLPSRQILLAFKEDPREGEDGRASSSAIRCVSMGVGLLKAVADS